MMNLSDFKELTIGGVKLKELLINGIQVWKAISYTNQITISTDANGNIYNGKGWKENTWVYNTGDSTLAGYYSTGYIPVKSGDVFRFKNAPLTKGNSYCRIVFYDSSKKRINHAHGGASYWLETKFKGVLNSNNSYDQFTLIDDAETAAMTAGMAYVRFTFTYLGADSIITINEEIK